MEFFSRSPEQTRRLGMRLGALLLPGDLVFLSGNLGAGKTTFVQGVAQGWGSLDSVSSPTFVIVNLYRRTDGQTLAHLDAYRLVSAIEAEDLDLDALLARGPLLVEWAERIQAALPGDHLLITMRYQDEEARAMSFNPFGARYTHMLKQFRVQVLGG
jgi:tRNA threonylcarbamoyladenosine biosynthesis protein TsaE